MHCSIFALVILILRSSTALRVRATETATLRASENSTVQDFALFTTHSTSSTEAAVRFRASENTAARDLTFTANGTLNAEVAAERSLGTKVYQWKFTGRLVGGGWGPALSAPEIIRELQGRYVKSQKVKILYLPTQTSWKGTITDAIAWINRWHVTDDGHIRQLRSLDASGRLENQYSIGEKIGKGGYAQVYRAQLTYDKGTQVSRPGTYAVKVFKDAEHDADMDEFRILQMLQDNIYVPTVYDRIQLGNDVFIVMELVYGESLFDWWWDQTESATTPLREGVVAMVFRQIMDGVDQCHGIHVGHGDLKLQNFMVTRKGLIKSRLANIALVDFGEAKKTRTASGGEQRWTDSYGTPEYAAPEVQSRERERFGYDGEKADIWACGVILYLLLCNAFPPNGSEGHPTLFFERSPQAQNLASAMLDPKPGKRISMDDIREHEFFLSALSDWASIGLSDQPHSAAA